MSKFIFTVLPLSLDGLSEIAGCDLLVAFSNGVAASSKAISPSMIESTTVLQDQSVKKLTVTQEWDLNNLRCLPMFKKQVSSCDFSTLPVITFYIHLKGIGSINRCDLILREERQFSYPFCSFSAESDYYLSHTRYTSYLDFALSLVSRRIIRRVIESLYRPHDG